MKRPVMAGTARAKLLAHLVQHRVMTCADARRLLRMGSSAASQKLGMLVKAGHARMVRRLHPALYAITPEGRAAAIGGPVAGDQVAGGAYVWPARRSWPVSACNGVAE